MVKNMTKVKAVSMCMGCGKTVDTSKECYFDDSYGLYSHTECRTKLNKLLRAKTGAFENRKKEWQDRNKKRPITLEYHIP